MKMTNFRGCKTALLASTMLFTAILLRAQPTSIPEPTPPPGYFSNGHVPHLEAGYCNYSLPASQMAQAATIACSNPNAKSYYGGPFTPKKQLKALVVFVRMEDVVGANGWLNGSNGLDGWNHISGLPDDVASGNFDKMMYDDVSDFTDPFKMNNPAYNNISKFFYEMSKPKLGVDAFMMMGEPFKDSLGNAVSVDVSLSAANQYGLHNAAMRKMVALNSQFSVAGLDTRTNNPNFLFDNSVTVGDSKFDYIVFVHRYRNIWPGHTQIAPMRNMARSAQGFASHGASGTYWGKQTGPGFTICEGGWGADIFIHELAHTLWNAPHLIGANGVVGDYFTQQFVGWSAAGSKSFFTLNAWERWYLDYINMTDANGSNTDIRQASDLPVNGRFLLRDYVTTGDALKIKIPGQGTSANRYERYLWIENHQKISSLDHNGWANTDWVMTNSGQRVTLGDNPSGAYAFVTALPDQHCQTNALINGANGLKMLNASGNFDWREDAANRETNNWGNIFLGFERLQENPFQGHNPWYTPRINDPLNNNNLYALGLNTNFNIGGQESGSYFVGREKPTNGANYTNTMRCFLGDVPMPNGYSRTPAFGTGDVLDMTSNPSPVDYVRYLNGGNRMEPISLNGLRVSFREIPNSTTGTNDMEVTVQFEYVKADKDVRWCGFVELPNITNNSSGDLILASGKTIAIDKSGTANRHLSITSSPNTPDFANPSTFTIKTGASMLLEQNSKVLVMNGSTFVVEAGTELKIADGAELVIDATSTLWLKGGTITLLGPDSKLVIHGTIKTDAGVDFTFGGNGYAQFWPSNQLSIGTGGKFKIVGNDAFRKRLELMDNTTVHIFPNDLHLEGCLANYRSDAMLEVESGNVFTRGVWFEGNNTNSIGLSCLASNSVNIVQSIFTAFIKNDQGIGLSLNSLPNGANIERSNFTSNNLGIYSNSTSGTLYTSKTTFEHNSIGTSILGTTTYRDVLSRYESTKIGLSCDAKKSNRSGLAYLNGTLMIGHERAIFGRNFDFFINEQATIEGNTVGVHMQNDFNNGYGRSLTVGDVSCANIRENYAGIVGENIFLNIDAGIHACNRGNCSNTSSNDFSKNKYPFYIQNEFDFQQTFIPMEWNKWLGYNPSSLGYLGIEIQDAAGNYTIVPGYSDAFRSVESCFFDSERAAPPVGPTVGIDGWEGEIPALSVITRESVLGTDTSLVAKYSELALQQPKGILETHLVGFARCLSGYGLVSAKNSKFTKNEISIIVSPNPTASQWNIELGAIGDYQIEVFDRLGSLVASKRLFGEQTTIEASELKDGIYMLKVTDAKGTQITSKSILKI